MKAKIGLVGVLIVGMMFALVATGAFFTVNETQQAIKLQFGKPVGEPITKAGLHFKMPFVQEVKMIPKQILEWDGSRTEMPTREKDYISVDTFGRWRITDALVYYQRLRDERSAQSRLEDILGSETRNAVAKHNLIELIRTTIERVPTKDESLEEIAEAAVGTVGVLTPIRKGRSKIEEEIEAAASAKLEGLGIELMDVRIKRINYGPTVVEKIYERMKSEREQIASKFQSEGEGEAAKILGSKEKDLAEIESEAYKKVETVKGEADARATEVYARAYNQTPEAAVLYEFMKTMEIYKAVIDKDTTLLLTTDSDLFKFLKNADGETGGKSGDPLMDLRVNPFGE